MPWNYEIDEERKLVITSAWDTLTAEDVLDHQRQLSRDGNFNPDFFQLVDFSRVTLFCMDIRTVGMLARQQVFSWKSRRAFVAPGELAIGMSHLFIIAHRQEGGSEEMAIFGHRDDALQWLKR